MRKFLVLHHNNSKEIIEGQTMKLVLFRLVLKGILVKDIREL